jgi:hypothetical protein
MGRGIFGATRGGIGYGITMTMGGIFVKLNVFRYVIR